MLRYSFLMETPLYSKDMHVRLAEPGELGAACRVGTRAFNQNGLEWYPPGQTLVGVAPDGELVATLLFRTEPLWWGTAQTPAAAVSCVAADPAHQRKGYAGALMVGAIHHFRELGCAVSPLWPFSIAYYRKFGWELPACDTGLLVWPDMLRRMANPSPNTSAGSIRHATRDDLPAIESVYEKAAIRTNAQTVRPNTWWSERKNDWPETTLVHLDAGGSIAGYLIYRVYPRSRAQGVRIDITELHGLDLAAEAALLRATADLPDAVEIHATLPCDTLLPDLFPDYITLERLQRLMLRVVDPCRALEALHAPQELNGKLGFEIYDPIVHHDGPVYLTADISGGKVSVSLAAQSDAIRCDIRAFSRLYSGGLRVAQGRALGIVTGGNAPVDRLCDALLHGRIPYRSHMEPG